MENKAEKMLTLFIAKTTKYREQDKLNIVSSGKFTKETLEKLYMNYFDHEYLMTTHLDYYIDGDNYTSAIEEFVTEGTTFYLNEIKDKLENLEEAFIPYNNDSYYFEYSQTGTDKYGFLLFGEYNGNLYGTEYSFLNKLGPEYD